MTQKSSASLYVTHPNFFVKWPSLKLKLDITQVRCICDLWEKKALALYRISDDPGLISIA